MDQTYCILSIEFIKNVLFKNQLNKHWLELSKPGVSHDGTKDGSQVAQGHKSMIDGGGQVIIPMQEVPEIQHQHR